VTPPVSWSLKFDEPIPLANGKPLRTLRDAGNYVAALQKKESALPHWQVAASCLLTAVEKGGGLVMMARIAMVRALNAQRKKPAKKYEVVG
jgi:hypothetical protein